MSPMNPYNRLRAVRGLRFLDRALFLLENLLEIEAELFNGAFCLRFDLEIEQIVAEMWA